MKLSPAAHQRFEVFFRRFFADENLKLPASRIYAKRGARVITGILRVEGITLGRNIFVKPAFVQYRETDGLTMNKKLLAHELTHVIQYQKLGFIGFLRDYLREYLRGLQRKRKLTDRARLEAYWEISHEIEAREAAARFIEWSLTE